MGLEHSVIYHERADDWDVETLLQQLMMMRMRMMMMMERADRGGQLTAGHRCIVCQPPSRHTRRSSDISVTICQDRDETRPTKIYDAFHILRLHGTVTDTYIHIHTQSCKQTDGRTDRQTDRQTSSKQHPVYSHLSSCHVMSCAIIFPTGRHS